MLSSFHCFYPLLGHGICCIEQYFDTDLEMYHFYSIIYQVMCPYAPKAQISKMYCCVVELGQSSLDTYQEAS